jgi:ferrous iron transport protein B
MGVEEDNWEATVAIFTGILAKETVVGTLNSLYTQEDAPADGTTSGEPAGYELGAALGAAVATIPANLEALPGSITDPFGFSVMAGSSDDVAAQVGASSSVFAGLQQGFTGGTVQVYAYLLFVLLYLPCVASFGAMTREMGLRYTLIAVAYIAVVSWSIATLFFQLGTGGSATWIAVSLLLLAGAGLAFWILGIRERSTAARRTPVSGAYPAAG